MHKLTSGGSPILTNIKSIIALIIKENNGSDVFGKMSPKWPKNVYVPCTN